MNNQIKFVNGNKRVNIYIALTLVFILISVVLHTVAWTTGYDTEMGEYSTDNKIGYIAGGLTFVFVVILLTSMFTVKKDLDLDYGFSRHPDIVESYLGSLSSGLIAAYSIITFSESVKTVKELIATVNNGVYGQTANLFNYSKLMKKMYQGRILGNSYLTKNLFAWIGILMFPIGLAFCAYMIISAMCRKNMGKALMWLGFFPVIWGCVCLIRIYFDYETAINDPMKIFLQMSVASMILFFLMELRSRVGKSCPTNYTAAATVGALLEITCPLSLIIARFFGMSLANRDLMLLFTVLSIGIFTLYRLLAVNKKRRIPELSEGDKAEA